MNDRNTEGHSGNRSSVGSAADSARDQAWLDKHTWCGIYPECCPGYNNYFGALFCPWTRIVPGEPARYKRAVVIDVRADDFATVYGEPERPSDILDAFSQVPHCIHHVVDEVQEGAVPRHTHAVTVAPCQNCSHARDHDFIPIWQTDKPSLPIQCVEPYCNCCSYEVGEYFEAIANNKPPVFPPMDLFTALRYKQQQSAEGGHRVYPSESVRERAGKGKQPYPALLSPPSEARENR